MADDAVPLPPPVRLTMPTEVIDARKDAYLRYVILQFPLKPHWVIETRHGFHALFRVQPQREPKRVGEAEALSRRLVRVLRGDANATLLTQLLRVPGTWHMPRSRSRASGGTS